METISTRPAGEWTKRRSARLRGYPLVHLVTQGSTRTFCGRSCSGWAQVMAHHAATCRACLKRQVKGNPQ